MSELEHSKRTLERATYTPIKLDRQDDREPGRALDKWSYFAALSPTAREVTEVICRMTSGENRIPEDERNYLTVLQAAASDRPESPSSSLPLKMMPEFAPVPANLLQRFGAELLQVREQEVNATVESHAAILTQYEQAIHKSSGGVSHTKPAIPKGYKLDADFVLPGLPGAKVYRYESEPTAMTAAQAEELSNHVEQDADESGMIAHSGALVVRSLIETAPPARPETTPVMVGTLMEWAISQNVEKARAEQTLALAQRLSPAGAMMTLTQYKQSAMTSISVTRDINYSFVQRLQIEPIGLLHLERLSFIPAGIERGELVYSVPLSPGEEVNISHKEWSNTSEEFKRIVTDFIEDYSEEGVTEKSELAQSTSSQQQHSSGFNLRVTASGGFSPVSISTSVGYNVSDSARNSQKTSRKQSHELTHKASSRVKKEHKMSFKVASASGTEDQAVRRIKNPLRHKAARVDYYQLVRKWRVDLYRYGLRMVYDITIPEPGSDILSKIIEIKSLTAALQEGFGSADSTVPWARFDLKPHDIQRDTYLDKAALYNATVEPPPEEYKWINPEAHRQFTVEEAKRPQYNTLEIDVPDQYYVESAELRSHFWRISPNEPPHLTTTEVTDLIGKSGKLVLVYDTRYLRTFYILLRIKLALKPEAFEAWQLKAWSAIYEAAQARYELNRTMLKNRLSQLQDELGAQDALSLRKAEREEVMKHVLRWLFGPSFVFVPEEMPEDLYSKQSGIVDTEWWGKMLAMGEIIKFLHQAIEWENMVFFLYPYFWSHTKRWELKKYLHHPDFLHQSFLKSGSARVVLTIRPGFERDFVSFLEKGRFADLPADHPYMTIAQEIEAFAKTNYPGVRAANPIENARPLLSPLQQRAWNEMQKIIKLLEEYKTKNGAYPTTAQGLAALAGLGTVQARDPWGNAYEYRSPGAITDFELWSFGADGKQGGEGEDADITSWAEASLIGQWYEYTPTSALDIAFNETLPSA